jgi:single-strand DNA-binding protein
MQNFTLIGIISKDTEYRMTEKGDAMVRLTVRVPSNRKDEQGRRISDFFDMTAWGKTAMFIQEFFKKDMPICIQATIQNHKYEKQGVTVYTNNFIINKVDFVPSQKNEVSHHTNENLI